MGNCAKKDLVPLTGLLAKCGARQRVTVDRGKVSMRYRALGAATTLGLGLLVAQPANAATVVRPYDFDGNGRPDLVVGAPHLQVGAVREAGGVVALPGTTAGLSLSEKVVSQSSRGLPGASETGDEFGAAVTSADFNRD